MNPKRPISLTCPKCKRKKYVARSYQAGYRTCQVCKIKWSMKDPSVLIKIK